MSGFVDNVLDLCWAASEGVVDHLKALSRSLVEDDEYVLIFILCFGVPSVVVLIFIARHIRRTHDRVRYAAEYVERDSGAFATSSSDTDVSSVSDDEAASVRRFSMKEMAAASERLTAQETVRRRAARRAAAAETAAEAATAEEAARAVNTVSDLPSPAAAEDKPDKKND